ncbi:MAG: elongation factor P [Thermoguttaceae bacterium]|nr:elongation factor P [Thermoguttaceae bacterium]
MSTYNTSEFRKGLKVQIDGNPYIMIECLFVKPGKGQALYKCKLRDLNRGTILERTYKNGDELEAADIHETDVTFMYEMGDTFFFMEKETYEQYELSRERIDDAWKYLLPEVPCKMLLYNDAPIGITPPPHVVLKVEYTEPAVRGNTATNVTKPAKLETGAEIIVPNFVETGELIKVDTRTNEYVERVKE